eukprot:CAMPEP_0185814060 /NCGR_PEP_ID=MMETSP1322-20130828/12950_1 /TAXON_ID=265543 /ORGANISM="Minutocellus polymorphus, Strain RCC2270" /LENGTH=82 /DNA_ID=CAMNT_0028510787 /DNA_START=1 /DNA_END=249 /DNA_ORIENTATION=-
MKASRRGAAAPNGLDQRMTASNANNDFAKIFGKREAQERAQENADRFIEAHSDRDSTTGVAFIFPGKNATNTTKGKYARQAA